MVFASSFDTSAKPFASSVSSSRTSCASARLKPPPAAAALTAWPSAPSDVPTTDSFTSPGVPAQASSLIGARASAL
jgi:hypothetical protein